MPAAEAICWIHRVREKGGDSGHAELLVVPNHASNKNIKEEIRVGLGLMKVVHSTFTSLPLLLQISYLLLPQLII